MLSDSEKNLETRVSPDSHLDPEDPGLHLDNFLEAFGFLRVKYCLFDKKFC